MSSLNIDDVDEVHLRHKHGPDPHSGGATPPIPIPSRVGVSGASASLSGRALNATSQMGMTVLDASYATHSSSICNSEGSSRAGSESSQTIEKVREQSDIVSESPPKRRHISSPGRSMRTEDVVKANSYKESSAKAVRTLRRKSLSGDWREFQRAR